ncbi:MAG: ComF family protein [Bacteroidaceae bacterium]|nr:ComF family protein [Bacteroidaceae bacterium]
MCGKILSVNDIYLCPLCLHELPLTNLHKVPFNSAEQRFAGVRIEHATGYIWYEKNGRYSAVLQDLKYRNQPGIGEWLSYKAAKEMPDYFNDIEAIVPVPLHLFKIADRGYNQSAMIAQGISKATGVPVYANVLKAMRPTSSQTSKNAFERYLNTKDLYAVRNKYASIIKDMHILLVDDVLTTGSTLRVCAQALLDAGASKITVFTLAIANH